MKDKVLVTLLVGEPTQKLWTSYMEKGWRLYAEKHGYDLLLFDRFLDDSEFGRSRKPHWQKLLTMCDERVMDYRQAVWVDADININHFTAPCIASQVRSDRIGCVVRQTGAEAIATYRAYGVEPKRADQLTNTGVFVIQPERHAQVMRDVYRSYVENAHSMLENVPLSYHLFEYDLAEAIDPRFNVDWTLELVDKYPFLTNLRNPHTAIMKPYCLHVTWAKSYFLHFINQAITYENGAPPYYTRNDIAALFQDAVVPAELVVS